MSGKKVKLDFQTEDVMERQRDTICVKGQEVPTWQFVWKQFHKLEFKIRKQIMLAIIWLSIMLLVISVIAMKS